MLFYTPDYPVSERLIIRRRNKRYCSRILSKKWLTQQCIDNIDNNFPSSPDSCIEELEDEGGIDIQNVLWPN